LARLLADENFPNPAVEGLRQLGHDVLTAAELNLAGLGTPDEDLLAFAHADGRAVLTQVTELLPPNKDLRQKRAKVLTTFQQSLI